MRQRLEDGALTAAGTGLLNRIGCDPISSCSLDERVDALIRTMPEFNDMLEKGAKRPCKDRAGAFAEGSDLPSQLNEYFLDNANRGHCSNSPTNCSSDQQMGATLKSHKTLIIMGIDTDYCVLSTVIGAMDSGYHVVVVDDACSSSQPGAHEAQVQYTFRSFGEMIKVMTSDDLVQMLQIAVKS